MSAASVSLGALMASLLIFAGASVGANDPSPESVVWTAWPMDVSGLARVDAPGAAVLVESARDLENTRLQGDHILVETAWEQGFKVRNGDASVARYVADGGVESTPLAHASLAFAPSTGADRPQFFAYSETGTHVATAMTDAGLRLTPTPPEVIVAEGTSPREVGTNDGTVGFWYENTERTVKASAAGSVLVKGNFTLFVHDVVVRAKADTGSWSMWTGYREGDPDAAVTDFELRITRIKVTNGAWITAPTEKVALFSDQLALGIEGAVTALDAIGHIVQDDSLYLFDASPLALEGTGDLRVRVEASPPSARETDPLRPWLQIVPSASLRITDASGAQVTTIETAGSDWRSTALPGALGLAATMTIGGMVLGIVPAPRRSLRKRQSMQWMRRGHKARLAERWRQAAGSFRMAAHLDRSSGAALYELAYTELEAGHIDRAERVAKKAQDMPGVDPADVIDLLAAVAWSRGDTPSFRAYVSDLASLDPDLALRLLADLGADGSFLQAAPSSRAGGVIDGYA